LKTDAYLCNTSIDNVKISAKGRNSAVLQYHISIPSHSITVPQ